MSRHIDNNPACICARCIEDRSERRIAGAHDNGWTPEEIAEAGGFSLAHVSDVLSRAVRR